MNTPFVGFTEDSLQPLGAIGLEVTFGEAPIDVVSRVRFIVVNAPSAYNAIFGWKILNDISAIASTSHLMIKFPTRNEVGVSRGEQQTVCDCYQVSLAIQVAQIEKGVQSEKPKLPGVRGPVEETGEVDLGVGKVTKMGTTLPQEDREVVKACLVKNADIFVGECGIMPGIDMKVAEHHIKLFEGSRPVQQRKQKLGEESQVIGCTQSGCTRVKVRTVADAPVTDTPEVVIGTKASSRDAPCVVMQTNANDLGEVNPTIMQLKEMDGTEDNQTQMNLIYMMQIGL